MALQRARRAIGVVARVGPSRGTVSGLVNTTTPSFASTAPRPSWVGRGGSVAPLPPSTASSINHGFRAAAARPVVGVTAGVRALLVNHAHVPASVRRQLQRVAESGRLAARFPRLPDRLAIPLSTRQRS
jgi:hypothetical protein